MSEQTLKTVGVMICAAMIAFLIGIAYIVLAVPKPITLEQQMDQIREIKSGLNDVGTRLDKISQD